MQCYPTMGHPTCDEVFMSKASQRRDELAHAKVERGSGPLHHQVYSSLRAKLDSGEWPEGHRLPTMQELSSLFGCSMITVRRALQELVRERRVVTVRGNGTFVRGVPLERQLNDLTSFTDEMHGRGLDPKTVILAAELVEASQAAAEALAIAPGTSVYRIERVRHVGSEPLLLEEVQLPAHLFPGLLERDLESGSLYDILAANYGIELAWARETVEPALPSSREARQLDQDRRQPVLLLTLISYSDTEVPVEYCRSLVRGDRARYHLEARRVHTQRPATPTKRRRTQPRQD